MLLKSCFHSILWHISVQSKEIWKFSNTWIFTALKISMHQIQSGQVNSFTTIIAILLKLGRIVVWGFLGLGLLGFFELVAFDLAVKIIVMRQNWPICWQNCFLAELKNEPSFVVFWPPKPRARDEEPQALRTGNDLLGETQGGGFWHIQVVCQDFTSPCLNYGQSLCG